jgi:hypothetical protein
LFWLALIVSDVAPAPITPFRIVETGFMPVRHGLIPRADHIFGNSKPHWAVGFTVLELSQSSEVRR